MLFESRFIYHPVKYPSGPWDFNANEIPNSPAILKRPAIQEITLTTPDQLILHGLYAPYPHDDHNRAPRFLLWLHGNAGNVAHRYQRLCLWWNLFKLNIVIIDYRGYGKSQGRPSETGLYTDARAAFDFMVHEYGATPQNTILQGNSLGGAVASHLAMHIQPAGLILNAAFTNIPDMAKLVLPFIPSWLVKHRYPTEKHIQKIHRPILINHGQNDDIIPHWMGERLAGLAGNLYQFQSIPNADHDNIYYSSPPYHENMRAFIEHCL